MTIACPKESDTIFVTLQLEAKQETPYVESGSFIIPLPEKTSWQIGKPGGIVDPKTDIQDGGNHALFNLERQVTVHTKQSALSI